MSETLTTYNASSEENQMAVNKLSEAVSNLERSISSAVTLFTMATEQQVSEIQVDYDRDDFKGGGGFTSTRVKIKIVVDDRSDSSSTTDAG